MDARILGAGGYGLVISAGSKAKKLFYDLDAAASIREEAEIQQQARRLLGGVVSVPEIYTVRGLQISWNGPRYLDGIEMDAVPCVDGWNEQIHILLGYSGGADIDTSWGRNMSRPVGPDNPTRGFFAGPTEMEAILVDTGSKISLGLIAWKMGWATRRLLGAGILPIDLEWIYGGDDCLWLIDFGLCRYDVADPDEFLYREGSEGLATDIYIPQAGSEHRGSFLLGWHAAMKTWKEIESSTADN